MINYHTTLAFQTQTPHNHKWFSLESSLGCRERNTNIVFESGGSKKRIYLSSLIKNNYHSNIPVCLSISVFIYLAQLVSPFLPFIPDDDDDEDRPFNYLMQEVGDNARPKSQRHISARPLSSVEMLSMPHMRALPSVYSELFKGLVWRCSFCCLYSTLLFF